MAENRWVFLGWKKKTTYRGPRTLLIYTWLQAPSWSLSCLVFGEVGSYWDGQIAGVGAHAMIFSTQLQDGAVGSSMPVPCQSSSTFSLHHLSFPVQCHLPMNQESYTCSITKKGETSSYVYTLCVFLFFYQTKSKKCVYIYICP